MADACFTPVFTPKFRPEVSGPPTCKMNWEPLENALQNAGDRGATGVAAKHDQKARVEAATKIISNRQAVLNDICNPARKSVSRIIEVVPAHLSIDVENGMRETARRLLGNSSMMPINRPDGDGREAWVSMAKVMDARLQTSQEQCPDRKPDMSAAAGNALRDVLKEVCGEQFPSRVAPFSSGKMFKPTNAGPPTCKSDWSSLERALENYNPGLAINAAAKHSQQARFEAARKLITNRQAVLNDVCNPARKTMHNIHEVVPLHLAGTVESGMKETVRRLIGAPGGVSRPDGPTELEAWVGMAKVISSRLQTSTQQCPNRAPDMSEEAAQALVDVLKEVSGASFQRKVQAGHAAGCSIM